MEFHDSGPLQQAVERVGVLIIALIQMTVAISGNANRAMAHPPGERIDIHIGRNRERGIGVAHVVKANIRHFGASQQRIELPVNVAMAQRCAVLTDEH